MENSITTPELFRLLSLSIGKEKPATPYMVAKVLQVAQTTAISWERGHRVMDEKHAEKAIQLLNLDRDMVQLSLEAERKEKAGLNEIAAIFRRAAQAVSSHGNAAAVAFFTLSALPSLVRAAAELCILCKTQCFPFKALRSGRRRSFVAPAYT